MTRRTRIVLFALLAPALATVGFAAITLIPLALIGITYPPDRIQAGMIFFFACWQIIAIWWLWKNWRE